MSSSTWKAIAAGIGLALLLLAYRLLVEGGTEVLREEWAT